MGNPTSWLIICTITAAWEKVFSKNSSIGFLAIANKFQSLINSGNIRPQNSQSQLVQLVFNNRVDAGLTSFFMITVVILALFSIRTILSALKSATPTSHETPYLAIAANDKNIIVNPQRIINT